METLKSMKKKEMFQYILAALIVVCFFGILILLAVREVPTENKDLLNIVIGALIGVFSGIVSYFFGSSIGSAKKDDIISGQK